MFGFCISSIASIINLDNCHLYCWTLTYNSVAICNQIANREETIWVFDFSDCSFATTRTIPNIICTQFYSTHLLLLKIWKEKVWKDDRCPGFNIAGQVPFIVIVVFNAATVFTLCRNRIRRNTVSGTRDFVSVFTKLTLIAGLSFVFSFAPITYYFVFRFTYDLSETTNWYHILNTKSLAKCMQY